MSNITAAPIVENNERLLCISKHGVHDFGANKEAYDWSSSADHQLGYTMTLTDHALSFWSPNMKQNPSYDIPNTMNPIMRLMIQISVC